MACVGATTLRLGLRRWAGEWVLGVVAVGARVGVRSLVGVVVAGLLVSGGGMPVVGLEYLAGPGVGDGSLLEVDEARVVTGDT